jgi:hypothetical protein
LDFPALESSLPDLGASQENTSLRNLTEVQLKCIARVIKGMMSEG